MWLWLGLKLAEVKVSIDANSLGLPTSTKTIDGGLGNIVNLIFGLIGSLAVVAILYGSVQLALSEGDPGKVKTARSTILYAAVGIILAASAYLVVWFITHNLFNGPDFTG